MAERLVISALAILLQLRYRQPGKSLALLQFGGFRSAPSLSLMICVMLELLRHAMVHLLVCVRLLPTHLYLLAGETEALCSQYPSAEIAEIV